VFRKYPFGPIGRRAHTRYRILLSETQISFISVVRVFVLHFWFFRKCIWVYFKKRQCQHCVLQSHGVAVVME